MTPITTPFTVRSTAAEVLADVDLSGKHRPEGFTEPATAVAPYALHPVNARRLWELSLAAVSSLNDITRCLPPQDRA